MKKYSSTASTNTLFARLGTALYSAMILVLLAQSGLVQSQSATAAPISVARLPQLAGRVSPPLFCHEMATVSGPVVVTSPPATGCAGAACSGCKTTVTITCAGGACKPVPAFQMNTVSWSANSTQSALGDAAPPALAGNDNKEPTNSAVTNGVHFADAAVNSTFHFARGLPGETWLKTSTNLAKQLVTGRVVQVRKDAAISVVCQGVAFEKVPLHSTFYFLLDPERARPWIKASATTAANPRDGRTYPIRSGLVALASPSSVAPLTPSDDTVPAMAVNRP